MATGTPLEVERRKVALTGAGGFVGSRILTKLLASGYHVKAQRFRREIPEHEHLTIVPGTLGDQSSLRSLVKDTQTVVHCGGIVAARRASDFFEVNERGTANLLGAMADEDINKILYISSLAARKPDISDYAASKYAGERILAQSSIEFWDILRPPAVYGPGDRQLLPLLQLLKNRVGLLPAGKQGRVSVIYVDDLARAVSCWLDAGSARKKIYEIDDGQIDGYSWQTLLSDAAMLMDISPIYFSPPFSFLVAPIEVYTIIARLMGKTPFLTAGKLRELAYPDWVCHKCDLERDIGWVAETSFQVGMEETLLWYRQLGLINNLNMKRVP